MKLSVISWFVWLRIQALNHEITRNLTKQHEPMLASDALSGRFEQAGDFLCKASPPPRVVMLKSNWSS